MESTLLPTDGRLNRLFTRDYVILATFCCVLFGCSLILPRVFTTHETVHCQNVREMFTTQQWLIPTYGGRPWLERPPAPHWFTGLLALPFGIQTNDWSMRIGSILIASIAVLVFGWSIAGSFGRQLGILSAAILASMREFASYACGPEADIFLASTVTICGSLYLRLQQTSITGHLSFFGRRPWSYTLFFALLGLTNWMKGPLFGMIFIVLPVLTTLVWNRTMQEWRRVAWCWGWMLLIMIGLGWPIIAYLRYPDILELWAVDYGVRWQSGYIGEPVWYYLVNQPWNIFPWTAPALWGMVISFRTTVTRPDPALRFILCWAVVPVCFFSLFKGKHHHYMLSCLAPAALFAAYGAVHIWQSLKQAPGWFRQPWLIVLICALAEAILLRLFWHKIPGPIWIHWLIALTLPVVVGVGWWCASLPNGTWAFISICSLIIVCDYAAYAYRSGFLDNYAADRIFVEKVQQATEGEDTVYVLNDLHPLNSSWLLYYIGPRTHLLHNASFLRDNRITKSEIYLVCRSHEQTALAEYGAVRVIHTSSHARGEQSPGDRWVLVRLHFHPSLVRVPGTIRISPMQATGRRQGPFLASDPEIASHPLNRIQLPDNPDARE